MIENARIAKTFLGVEDHGILTAYVMVDGDGWGGGFGGFALDQWREEARARVAHAACGVFIAGMLRTLDAESWEKLPDTFCRVERDGRFGPIKRIGHPIKDRWFGAEDMGGLR